MAEVNLEAALRGGRPIPATEAELKAEVGQRIASGVDVNPNTPAGAALEALTQSIAEGKSGRQTVTAVAGAAGAAAGAVCLAAAPVCSVVFGAVTSQLAGAVHDMITGKVAVGAGRMSKKAREENLAKEEALLWANEQIENMQALARQEYVNRIARYITPAEVYQHFVSAFTASGIQVPPIVPFPNNWSPQDYLQLHIDRVNAWANILPRVLATYGAVQAEVEALRRQRIAASLEGAKAGAIAMQHDYGVYMKQTAAKLRACGIPRSEISAHLTNKDWRERTLKTCLLKQVKIVPKKSSASKYIIFGVAALLFVGGTGYMFRDKLGLQ